MRARKKGVTPTRLLAILKRQAEPRWGSDYTPSILATPQEAPSISHACTLNSSKLGREVHCPSLSATAAVLFALYDPAVVEPHEQGMAGHMEYLKLLPRVRIENPYVPGSSGMQVFPYISDLLLFRRRGGDDGPYYVNWSIKHQQAAFRSPIGSPAEKPRQSQHGSSEILARHDLLPGCGNPPLLKFRTQVCGRRNRSACLHDSALPCTPQGVRVGAGTENT